jgi:leucyl-tRNA synthetase
MGWDAFGLPAENDAIKKGIHPKISTEKNIANFKKQLSYIGAIYDWDKEMSTADTEYYKWTQWIFLKMYEAGLAYQANTPINWCPKCLTGLANEEVVNGECERCGTQTTQKPIRQWILKITKYAERLLSGLKKLEWPEKVKLMQENWIGKSIGAKIIFTTDTGKDIEIFTTRPDTLGGVSFIVIAPEHTLVEKITIKEQENTIKNYIEETKKLSELERTLDTKEKSGAFTGSYAINPLNNTKVPIFIASYVLTHYGTGAVMGVPAHDQRDFEFAQKFNLPVREVIKSKTQNSEYYKNNILIKAFEGDGTFINYGPELDGLDSKIEGTQKIFTSLKQKGKAQEHITYKLRDWVFSRQRYWGEPIPIVHCTHCGIVPVPEDQLPILLPDIEKYQPTGTGESPLADIKEWVNTPCPNCKGPAKRETNTMPQWAGSSWYFLRYPDPKNKIAIFNKEEMKYWLPVDLYVGGIEHAILHLLYSRFYVKVLYDLEYLPFEEPFKKLFNQGMLCMKSPVSGRVEKMSKSKGNVINPEDMIEQIGTDALRTYILFMGPPELDSEWQSDSIKGVRNFLCRLWSYLTDQSHIKLNNFTSDIKTQKRFHKFLKDYQTRIEDFKPNTAVAALMEYLNDLEKDKHTLDSIITEQFLVAFSIMAPHFSSELLERLLNKQLEHCPWPQYDEKLAEISDVEIAIQVNGKLRNSITVPKGSTQTTVETLAKTAISKWLENNTVIKIIFVQDRLINFVVKF